MNPQNTPQAPAAKAPSTKPSIAGGVFSILALILSGIGNLLAHAHYKSPTAVTTNSEKVSEAVAKGTTKTLGAILSVPFLSGAILFGIIALILTLIRLGKVKATGLIWSLIWLALSIWAIMSAIGGFDLIRYHAPK